MLREQAKVLKKAHSALDIGLTAGAFIAAYFVKRHILPGPFGGLSISPNYYIILLMIIIWYLTFAAFRIYASYRTRSLYEILWTMVKAVSTGMGILLLAIFIFKIQGVSRLLLGVFFIFDTYSWP